MRSSRHAGLVTALVLAPMLACGGPNQSDLGSGASSTPMVIGARLVAPARFSESGPLSLTPPAKAVSTPEHEPMRLPRRTATPLRPDQNVQTSAPALLMPAVSAGFEAQGDGFSGPAGKFSVIGVPPDPNGSIGPNHYVQTVNSDLTVFDRAGKALLGPVQINTLFNGMGNLCEQHNDGDPVVVYDKMADRWVISQFAVTIPSSGTNPPGSPYFHCIAVSKTGDPTGSYYRYAYQYENFNDYPKMSVWPDAYYQTFNMFDASKSGTPFVGAKICAYDRVSMLAGKSANQQCFMTTDQYGGVLSADLDGKTAPPAGSPNYLMSLFDNNNLAFWRLHIDWTDPSKTNLVGPINVPVASYTVACDDGKTNTCITQSGTSQQLDALSDRLMFRLAYRNFGDHESMVVTHAIKAGTTNGVRWYEIRLSGGNPTVYQQGTYAPDQESRWLGSAAMDAQGNIAIGFSVSGADMKPAIRVAGRMASDPLNLLARGESSVIEGTGSQTASLFQPLSRWGDYSSLSVDPNDDCTFWYTDEYIKTDGSANWHTRVGAFSMPGCIAPAPTPTSLTATITGPKSGSTLAGAAVQVSGEASGPKAIARLEFFVDGSTALGTSTTSPAVATWDTTKAAEGTHSLTVRATDAAGTVVTSAPVDVTVKNTGSGGGGTCPPGQIDIGGVCVGGCNTAGLNYGWVGGLLVGAFALLRRRTRRS